jgi:U3 small nucleolar RNA-associated protein 4
MLEVHRCRQIDWTPSAVVALATSFDGTLVAAARENGAIEIWSVAAGSVGWHCQLRIAGRKDAEISSLVWCESEDEDEPHGRLFSAGLDGFITEWNLQTLQPKEAVESMGGAVWQLAAEHVMRSKTMMRSSGILQSRGSQEDESGSDSEDASSNGSQDEQDPENREQRVAVACEDGCVRIFAVSDKQLGMIYHQSFPRVKGEISLAHLPSARTLFDCEDCTLMSELL